MQTVSTAYKTQINYPLRDISYIRVNLGVVDVDAPQNDTISTNGEVYFSEKNDIDKGETSKKTYHTMEHNRMILDGNGLLSPEVGSPINYYQGYVSEQISGADGTFTTNPVITLDFSMDFNFIGLVFRFDKILGCYPSEIQIQGFLDTVEVYNQTIYPTTTEYLLETPVPSTGKLDQLKLTFKKTFPPKRRVRLEYIMFGLVKIFDDTVVTDSEWKRNIDLVTAKLPTNSFTFTAIDINKDYNPDNATGFWQYIEKRQPVSWEYGYQLEDGSVEWIKGGNLYTDGDIKTDSTGAISTVTFSASSLLNQMPDIYYKGKYNSTPVTLYSLAEDVLAFAEDCGYTIQYSLDASLQSIYTQLPIPQISIAEALQLIANAGMCVLYVDRDGIITMKAITETLLDFSLDFSNMTSIPVIDKVPALATVTTSFTTPQIGTISETLMSTDTLTFATDTEVRFSYDEATDISLSVDGTLTIVGTPEYYATSCVAVLTGTGKATVSGKKLLRTTTTITYIASNKGYDCPIDNSLINTEVDAIAYATWIASILLRRNQYSVEERGYPELDITDCISVDTLFSTALEATITEIKLKYNGALSAQTQFLSKEVGT